MQTIERFVHPRSLSHLWLLAAAGVIGSIGNEIAAQVRLRAGRRLQSPALVADGKHARVDGFVSLGVLASAAVVAIGLKLADPVIGLAITIVIVRITWESWQTIGSSDRARCSTSTSTDHRCSYSAAATTHTGKRSV